MSYNSEYSKSKVPFNHTNIIMDYTRLMVQKFVLESSVKNNLSSK